MKYERKNQSLNVLEILRTGVVVEVETAHTQTSGEAAECIQAVGLHKKARRLISDPPYRAWEIDGVSPAEKHPPKYINSVGKLHKQRRGGAREK